MFKLIINGQQVERMKDDLRKQLSESGNDVQISANDAQSAMLWVAHTWVRL